MGFHFLAVIVKEAGNKHGRLAFRGGVGRKSAMRLSVFILGVFVAVIYAESPAEAAKLSVRQNIMAQLGHR
jgi:hypothetical protein